MRVQEAGIRTGGSASPRILLIDDHAALRRGVQEILADGFPGGEFGHAEDTSTALERLRNSHWDVAILDLNLPGRGGLDLIRGLKDEQPGLAVLVYSVHGEDQFGLRAIRAGADGYLTKDQPPEELKKAVATVLSGNRYVSGDLAAALLSDVKGHGRPRHHLLSDREMQVLQMLTAGKSPSQIGEELALSSKTISTYRSRILQKLELRTNADLVRYAIDQGISH